MSLRTLLELATEEGFNKLDGVEVGSDEYKSIADPLTKITDRLIEIDKMDLEKNNQKANRDLDEKIKIKQMEIDEQLRLKQMKQEQIDRYVKHGLTAVSVLGGLLITVWGAKASWKFEETGTVTSTAGRKFINNLFFRK